MLSLLSDGKEEQNMRVAVPVVAVVAVVVVGGIALLKKCKK